MANFALVGAAGYIAPRHMKAIHDTGNTLVAAVDPHDCVGRIDSFFPNTRFFTEIERFDRYLEKCRRSAEEHHVNFVSICTPNYLHDAHIRLALRVRAHAICEKPLVLTPWNLDALAELEAEYNCRVYNVLQLRLIEKLKNIKQEISQSKSNQKREVVLTYVTRRGSWYDVSWKGDRSKSGGPSMNIGVHFFDLLLWLFGEAQNIEVHLNEPRRMSGFVELEKARVRWFLSVDESDLPTSTKMAGKFAYRSMTLDGEEVEFSDGFTDLHTKVYKEIIAGNGFGINEARAAVELVHRINHTDVRSTRNLHPHLRAGLATVSTSQFKAAS
jgi:UDP-N-acetyl-2-amino-2-deoxyglucuronate dehydrogenase